MNLSYFSPANLQTQYIQFLSNFPVTSQPVVSMVIAILIIYFVYRVIKKDWIFIIAVVILIPASIPVLKSIWSGLVSVIQFLFHFGK